MKRLAVPKLSKVPKAVAFRLMEENGELVVHVNPIVRSYLCNTFIRDNMESINKTVEMLNIQSPKFISPKSPDRIWGFGKCLTWDADDLNVIRASFTKENKKPESYEHLNNISASLRVILPFLSDIPGHNFDSGQLVTFCFPIPDKTRSGYNFVVSVKGPFSEWLKGKSERLQRILTPSFDPYYPKELLTDADSIFETVAENIVKNFKFFTGKSFGNFETVDLAWVWGKKVHLSCPDKGVSLEPGTTNTSKPTTKYPLKSRGISNPYEQLTLLIALAELLKYAHKDGY